MKKMKQHKNEKQYKYFWIQRAKLCFMTQLIIMLIIKLIVVSITLKIKKLPRIWCKQISTSVHAYLAQMESHNDSIGKPIYNCFITMNRRIKKNSYFEKIMCYHHQMPTLYLIYLRIVYERELVAMHIICVDMQEILIIKWQSAFSANSQTHYVRDDYLAYVRWYI